MPVKDKDRYLSQSDTRIGMGMHGRWVRAKDLADELGYTVGSVFGAISRLRKLFGEDRVERRSSGYRFWHPTEPEYRKKRR